MRVLVVDDQRQFYEAIAPLLRSARLIATYAGTSEEARRAVAEAIFDLLLVDLQMPPGNWGGLEIIKSVVERDPVLPIVVVSGRGTVAECIAAVRLGAKDYIQKESFEKDLLERVLPIYTVPYAIQTYPSPIGYCYRSFREETTPYTKARKLLDVFEIGVRLVCAAIITEETQTVKRDLVDTLEQSGLTRPSLGNYVDYMYKQFKTSPMQDSFLAFVAASELTSMRGICDRFVECRNKMFGHSVTISVAQAEAVLGSFQGPLITFLNALSFFRFFRMFMADLLRFDGSRFVAEGRDLIGENLRHESHAALLSVPIATGHIGFLSRRDTWLDLHPMLVLRQGSKGEYDYYEVYDKLYNRQFRYSQVP